MEPKIKWKIEKRSVQSLKLLENNPRTITKEAFDRLKKRIIDRGMHDVLKIDTDGTVLSGNQRKQALIDLGIAEVLCMLPERPLTEEERSKVILESNRNDGEWDFELLANNFDSDLLEQVGFTAKEMGMEKKDKVSLTVFYDRQTMEKVHAILQKFEGDNHSDRLLNMMQKVAPIKDA